MRGGPAERGGGTLSLSGPAGGPRGRGFPCRRGRSGQTCPQPGRPGLGTDCHAGHTVRPGAGLVSRAHGRGAKPQAWASPWPRPRSPQSWPGVSRERPARGGRGPWGGSSGPCPPHRAPAPSCWARRWSGPSQTSCRSGLPCRCVWPCDDVPAAESGAGSHPAAAQSPCSARRAHVHSPEVTGGRGAVGRVSTAVPSPTPSPDPGVHTPRHGLPSLPRRPSLSPRGAGRSASARGCTPRARSQQEGPGPAGGGRMGAVVRTGDTQVSPHPRVASCCARARLFCTNRDCAPKKA